MGEPGPVVPESTEDPGTQDRAQARKAGEDGGVGVGEVGLLEGVLERGDVVDRGVQGPQVGPRLVGHSGLHRLGLTQLGAAQSIDDAGGRGLDAPAVADPAKAARTPLTRSRSPAAGAEARCRVARASRLDRSSKMARKAG